METCSIHYLGEAELEKAAKATNFLPEQCHVDETFQEQRTSVPVVPKYRSSESFFMYLLGVGGGARLRDTGMS